MFTHVDYSYKGSSHDRSLFNHSEIIVNKSKYFKNDQCALADKGFIGNGPILTLFRKG